MMRFSKLLASVLIAAACGPALGQIYPDRAITVIVPYAPGGNTDVVGRIVAEQMAVTLGQKMIIENVAGAGGTTGSARVAKAPADGYTILVGQMGTHAAAPGLYTKLAYDPVMDFEHIGQLSDTPIGIYVRRDFPVKTLREFIALVKAQPQKYNNGHGGVGATSHVSCVFLTSLIGARPPMIAYRGSGPAFNDLLARQFDFLCDQIPHTVEHVKSGSVTMLAVAMPQRVDVLPDIPTTIEAGLPAYQASGWNAMFAPKGTPGPIVEKLSQALRAALEAPHVRDRLDKIGALAPSQENRTPAGLRKFVASEIEKWAPILKAANVSAD